LICYTRHASAFFFFFWLLSDILNHKIFRVKNNCNSKFQVIEYWKIVAIIPFSKYFVTWYTLYPKRWKHIVYNYTNNQKDALYRLIYYSKSAVHVSGHVFAHRQEHLTVFTVSGIVFTQVAAGWQPAATWVNTIPDTVNTVKCSDDGWKHGPQHVEPTWNNKLIYIAHLVSYFHSCITMHGFMNVKCNI